MITQNSDFLFLFEAVMTNPNGDPDQENKPRMDYETGTCLVSDARRKRDVREMMRRKGYPIFVDTLAENKVPMDKMFEHVRDEWLCDDSRMQDLLDTMPELADLWDKHAGDGRATFKQTYEKWSGDKKKKSELTNFNNLFITEIIKRSLIDIRLFGSAMAVEGVSRTFTGPIQLAWGYSLHPVELVKSNTITSIMNERNSTFGKKNKVHYGLIAHYGTINKFNAQRTGMTNEDRELFRQALVQGIMSNQTDSKQGQTPLVYLEVVYTSDFDGYLGDLRRFLDVHYEENRPIRQLSDLEIDLGRLNQAIQKMKEMGYVEKVIGWTHPFASAPGFGHVDIDDVVDLWAPVELHAGG